MQQLVASAANDQVFRLAEGPIWDATRQRLLWVDIDLGLVFVGRLFRDGTIAVDERIECGETVGALVLTDDGQIGVAGADSLFLLGSGRERRLVSRIFDPTTERRLNDGETDPAGRFVVGTLSLSGDSVTEILVRLEADGTVTMIDEDLTLSNGLAWTANGRTMYSVDTMSGVIYRRSYDPMTGATGNRETWLVVDGGYPDGICLDAEGFVWVAVWGGAEVRRYSPSGELDTTVMTGALHTSSVAFGGPDLSTLVITSSTNGLSHDDLERYPNSGHLLTVRPGVRGLEPTRWIVPWREGKSA